MAGLSGVRAATPQTFRIPPLTTTVNVDEQPLHITVAGTITAAPAAQHQESIQVDLETDLSDMQAHITELLRPHVNQANRCGLRLNLEHASLAPQAPNAALTARVHVEKYVCAKAFGRQMITKLLDGDGVVTVRLMPAIENAETLKLSGEVVAIDADGPIGELLQSDTAGPRLREKVRTALADTLQKSLGKLKAELPPALHGLAALQTARFTDAGASRLGLGLAGTVQLAPSMAQIMLEKLKEQAH